eukprot:1158825-Pelagomonas_calceolata.AAC.13
MEEVLFVSSIKGAGEAMMQPQEIKAARYSAAEKGRNEYSRFMEACFKPYVLLRGWCPHPRLSILDRAEAAREAGYATAISNLLRPELHMYKSDLLFGVPLERVGNGRAESAGCFAFDHEEALFSRRS